MFDQNRLFLGMLFILLVGYGCSSHVMLCKTDLDCNYGNSCRSKSGGGTECRVKTALNIASPDTFTANCKNDFDCAAGYSCRTKAENGSECRIKTPTSDDVKTSPIVSMPAMKEPSESLISNLEEIKTKCQELGFKPKSDKFGKCVLELTK